MILSAPDVASAAKWSAIWEFCEYASEGLVFLGCVGEYIAEYTEWRTPDARHSLGRRSLLLLILGLGTGLFSLIKTNALAGSIIGSLGEQVEQAGEKAERVSTSLGAALSKATQAENVSSDALSSSRQAQTAATAAMTLARGARQEADSFEKDIVSAKTQAAAAESHLAEALKQAADATASLSRLKSPRSILNPDDVIAKLKPSVGVEFTFTAVFQEQEAILLLRSLDSILQRAGWKRVKPPGGFPAINIYGKAEDFSVPLALTDGIRIDVDASEAVDDLRTRPIDKLPPAVRAAVALQMELASHLSPSAVDAGLWPVSVDQGTSRSVRISVGKKP